MSAELTTFFTAMLPFIELKLAIPLGIKMGLSSTSAVFFASAGTMVPASLGLAVATPVSQWLRQRFAFWEKFFSTLFNKTRNDHIERFQEFGAIILITFVAAPLPASGAASGALVAFVFGIEYWKSIGLIALGIIIQSYLLLAGFTSVFRIFHHLFG